MFMIAIPCSVPRLEPLEFPYENPLRHVISMEESDVTLKGKNIFFVIPSLRFSAVRAH